MKKYWIALIFSLVSAYAFADGLTTDSLQAAGFSKLSESTKAEIVKTVAQAAEKAQVSTNDVVDTADKVLTFSDKFGASLAATARALGIAVNEFAVSPVGKLATVLIVWNMLSGMVLHMTGGILILLFGTIAIRTITNRSYPLTVEYDQSKRNIFGNYSKISQSRNRMSDSDATGYLVAYGIVAVVALVIMFSY